MQRVFHLVIYILSKIRKVQSKVVEPSVVCSGLAGWCLLSVTLAETFHLGGSRI